ncbi:cyclic nucleotide-binding domain-containing protein [Nocardioides sp.]|uniref:cyclic nucleotide-binding domain-containing protein n=1 Tax=Nocardioides sp. TaxID=35761 RepID=UPI00356AB95E
MKHHQDDLHDQLTAIPLLSGLSRRQVTKLLSGCKQVEHGPGHEIAVEGQGALALHLVLDGEARVTVHGTEVRRLGPGDHFGELSLIDGKRRSATVVAEGRLKTLAVPHAVFQNLLADEPDVALGLLKVLCARLREAERV